VLVVVVSIVTSRRRARVLHRHGVPAATHDELTPAEGDR
jgi:putative tricarboxylic transport membrane protein